MGSISLKLSQRLGLLGQLVTPTVLQLGLLMAVDLVTNITDYGFHLYLGWALEPGEFAIVQTMNAVLLIIVAAFGVTQPVVARFVAEAGADEDQSGRAPAVFRAYFRQSSIVGLVILLLALLTARRVAGWLNVPDAAVAVAAPMALLALIRPVASGMLQGEQRFAAFGGTRTVFALTRLALALLLVGLLGGGAVAGVATMPLAALAALLAGLALIGPAVWKQSTNLSRIVVWEGWRLSLAAFLAYLAYMALLSADLIWANRSFSSSVAASYATAVVFRRVLAVLPAAVLIIFYPRVVAIVSQGRVPDRILVKAALVVVAINSVLALLYYFLGPALVTGLYGDRYPAAGSLLGLMGLAMIGYGLVSLWMNLFLATRPWPFVVSLVGTAVLQSLFLARGYGSVQAMAIIFALSGWLLALGGLFLYLIWLRPRLR